MSDRLILIINILIFIVLIFGGILYFLMVKIVSIRISVFNILFKKLEKLFFKVGLVVKVLRMFVLFFVVL